MARSSHKDRIKRSLGDSAKLGQLEVAGRKRFCREVGLYFAHAFQSCVLVEENASAETL